MKLKSRPLFKISEIQILIWGFLLIIMVGAILLCLPISSQNHKYTNFIDSLFVATSATCVTGLTTVDTGTHWNYFGKTVILILIQVGGLGFMAFSTLIALILGRKITLRERLLIHESLNSFNIQGLVKMSKYILLFTFLVEAVGAVILCSQFVPQFGFYRGLFYSIFHSVSAFCNAGIDLVGEGRSLMPYYDNFTIIFTISILIIIGGLGFYVWQEIYNLSFKYTKRLSFHSKICITMTIILLISGTILLLLFEFDNPATIKNMNLQNKVLSSFFFSTSLRTAGFNSISMSDISENSKLLSIVFMFIGGAPGSTAGGIKTTTAALIIMTAVSIIKGRGETEIYKRTIKKDLVYRAVAIFVVYIICILTFCFILGVSEKNQSLESIIFECVSAFGTVGLSLGITSELSSIGKIIIIVGMFFGRLGSLTIVLSMVNRKIPKSIKYPQGKMLIG